MVRRSVGRWVDERRGEVGRGCLSVVDSQMGCERRAIERGVKVGEAKGEGGRIEARDAVGERMVGRGRSRGGWMFKYQVWNGVYAADFRGALAVCAWVHGIVGL